MLTRLSSPIGSLAAASMIALGAAPASSQDQSASQAISGPNATPAVLQSDAQAKDDMLDVNLQRSWDAWKTRLKETSGLDLGFDYNALGYAATSSLTDEDTTASGAFRVFGQWDLIDREGLNTGSLIFKVENRHRYGDVAPADFGSELGYAGLVSSVFNDQGWRLTNAYWKQDFAQKRGVAYIGFLDVTDYVDVYALASPWTGFSNLAFETGSGTIGGLPDGALGAMVGGFLNDNFYAAASAVDANADPTDPLAGFDNLSDQGETFKTLEFGWTSGPQALFVNNAHLTLWHIDARKEAGTREGKGVAFSYTHAVAEKWLPFVRGGWSEDGGSLYEASLSAGVGYSRNPGQDLLGVGVNWSRPNEDTFGAALDDQATIEVFQRLQLTEGIQITPSVQIIHNPALNPDSETVALFGLRLRAAF